MSSKILAHRGAVSVAPENTELAFEIASLLNFDGVELDVHQTKDNEIVIIHDETTNRTSNKDLKIEDSTLKELKKLNYLSKWKIHDSNSYNSILTLGEFLDLFLDKFKFINIEIKSDVIEYKGIEKNILNILNKYKDTKKKVILSSFNFSSLERFYQLSNDYKMGFLWWKIREFKKLSPKKIKEVCDYLNPWTKLYDRPELKKEYDKLNLPYNLWTIKIKSDYIKYYNDPKVDFIITNYKF